jgi:hypothetical protein
MLLVIIGCLILYGIFRMLGGFDSPGEEAPDVDDPFDS